MLLLKEFESQPDFPKVDLTDDNAAFLELMLANGDIVAQVHLEAENTWRVFKIGHQSILRAVPRLDYDSTQDKAIDYGTSMFETMSALVNSKPGDNIFKISDMASALGGVFDEAWLRKYFLDAYDCFQNQTPRAAEVVRSASRLNSALTEYAVLGAAISRHFDIDSAA
ncbi:MAG TPA: hypothetical protein PK096_00290 [Candidatus Saccharibacteria bacterium]|nr:hypothetical protein [Candidatus Saccharibacteria bacterium]HRK93794.1 hypothetical protein [Candidatus Saccharibacteria bacterium]